MKKIVFFGTPDFVLPVLDALKNNGYEIAAVVTQPPKPVGRKKTLTPSPVAHWAEDQGVRIIDESPKKIVNTLKELRAKVGVLEAYGRILPPEVLNVFPQGIVNVHPSLLPRWRGASPVEATIVAGDKVTGVTIIRLDEKVDHGPILTQFTEEVIPDDTKLTLRSRLFQKAADSLVSVLPHYLEGKLDLKEQDHSKATYTTLIEKEHGFIAPQYIALASQGLTLRSYEWVIPFIKNFTLSPSPFTLECFIRALDPWPGAWTQIKLDRKTLASRSGQNVRRLKVLKAHIGEQQVTSHESRVTLVLDTVQLEGKNSVSWKQFKEAYPQANFEN